MPFKRDELKGLLFQNLDLCRTILARCRHIVEVCRYSVSSPAKSSSEAKEYFCKAGLMQASNAALSGTKTFSF